MSATHEVETHTVIAITLAQPGYVLLLEDRDGTVVAERLEAWGTVRYQVSYEDQFGRTTKELPASSSACAVRNYCGEWHDPRELENYRGCFYNPELWAKCERPVDHMPAAVVKPDRVRGVTYEEAETVKLIESRRVGVSK